MSTKTDGGPVRFSRRKLGAAALSTAVVSAAQPPAQTEAQAGLAKTIHDANQRNSEALTKFEIPIATEPAFQFKA